MAILQKRGISNLTRGEFCLPRTQKKPWHRSGWYTPSRTIPDHPEACFVLIKQRLTSTLARLSWHPSTRPERRLELDLPLDTTRILRLSVRRTEIATKMPQELWNKSPCSIHSQLLRQGKPWKFVLHAAPKAITARFLRDEVLRKVIFPFRTTRVQSWFSHGCCYERILKDRSNDEDIKRMWRDIKQLFGIKRQTDHFGTFEWLELQKELGSCTSWLCFSKVHRSRLYEILQCTGYG